MAEAESMSMSLEDLIKKKKISNPRGGGRGGSRGRGGFRGGRGRGGASPRGNINQRWSHDLYSGPRRSLTSSSSTGPARLYITNLDYGVSDADIRELFSEFGALRSAVIHYDKSGRSLGTGMVIFTSHSDGMRAIKQYNGVHLDGRPMTIVLEGGGGGGRGQSMGGGRGLPKRLQGAVNGAGRGGRGSSRGGRGGRGGGGRGGRGGRGGGRGGEKEKEKSSEELDKELDDYLKAAKATPTEEVTTS